MRPERHLSLFFSGRVQQRDCVIFALNRKTIPYRVMCRLINHEYKGMLFSHIKKFVVVLTYLESYLYLQLRGNEARG